MNGSGWIGLNILFLNNFNKVQSFYKCLALKIYPTFSLDRKSRQKDQVVAATRLHF